ncbi:aldehyde dehydrogenase family protein [Burkholderia cepacia]|uniref:aldehyde dehydrogenase family protein n=1 Tax=Burkholderia cepacia TaxID=292 RepID=UPI001F3435BB|nr:aldehyde dehydrogenase family protein [Burkholderia cepacia]MCE4124408.1 aldehyde dehydrogenase family protein [Burkholderia cepacia]
MERVNYINNTWRAPDSGEMLEVVDPSTGDFFASIARGNAADVTAAVAAARGAMGEALDGPWASISPVERGDLMFAYSASVLDHRDELAELEARDTGKALKTARTDVTVLARYLQYYAGCVDKLHGETLPYTTGYTVLTVREPIGVTGHIIPWNYPMQIFGRSVGASLAAGNACVIKPAEDASLSSLRLAQIAAEVGFPGGAINVVTGLGSEAGAALSANAHIGHISFTGSAATGALVARAAADRHCPTVLELGGKSPQLLFEDADLDEALPVIVTAIVQNAGQTCSAGSRLLVQRSIYEMVVDRLAKRFAALRSGPPSLDLDMGPLVNAKQHARVRAIIAQAEAEGIPVAARGKIVEEAPRAGYFQEGVLFRDVPPQSKLAQEEVFGPVLAVMPFDDEADAVKLANGTQYGLVAGVWTRDGSRGMRLARKLQVGQVFVNNYGAGGGVELPFGGVKSSGYGREKGFEALFGFTSLKTIAVKHG